MFERFTDRARNVIRVAHLEARALGHPTTGPEHLLIALAADAQGLAGRYLTSVGLTVDTIRARVADLAGRGPQTTKRHTPMAKATKKVMEHSLREALKLGHNYIGTEHMILALLQEDHGVAGQILREGDLAYDDARALIVSLLQSRSVEGLKKVAGAGTDLHTKELRARSVAKPDAAPSCPSCKSSLERSLRYRIIDVAEQDGDGRALVMLVFCSSCGHTVDSLIAPEEP